MPLWRDSVRPSSAPCPCGWTIPRFPSEAFSHAQVATPCAQSPLCFFQQQFPVPPCVSKRRVLRPPLLGRPSRTGSRSPSLPPWLSTRVLEVFLMPGAFGPCLTQQNLAEGAGLGGPLWVPPSIHGWKHILIPPAISLYGLSPSVGPLWVPSCFSEASASMSQLPVISDTPSLPSHDGEGLPFFCVHVFYERRRCAVSM